MQGVLRLEPIHAAQFDVQLAALDNVRLGRSSQGIFLEIAPERAAVAIRLLALAGVRAEKSDHSLSPSAGFLPAIARSLEALDHSIPVLDLVDSRRVSLAEASAKLLSRRMPFARPSRIDRDHCRDLLRADDVLLAWRRVVWCPARFMRSIAAHGRLRPLIFDRSVLAHAPSSWSYASEGAIERWILR